MPLSLASKLAVVLSLGVIWPSTLRAGDPAVEGRWEAVKPWPVIAIHAAVMPTGEVLHFAYPSAEGAPDVRTYEDGTRAMLWNPRRKSFRDVSVSYANMFCGGHSFLADGTLYVTGGISQEKCPTGGTFKTYFFDPFLAEWTEGPDMRGARYYPTNVTRGDGSVVILAGDSEHCDANRRVELFEPGSGKLRLLNGAERRLQLYPRVHLLSDGRLAHVGPEPRTFVFDFKRKSWDFVDQTRLGDPRYEGFSVLLPGPEDRILICGGFTERDHRHEGEPTNTCEIIDFGQGQPKWRTVASMHFPRAHANGVLLPDGKVLVVGGGQSELYDTPIRNAELYDPETDSFTVLTAERFGRMYHSTAVLLPDGRVLSAGQDEEPNSPSDSHAFAEIYRPPYLFRGKRPKIVRAPEYAAYGSHVEVRASQSRRIRSVVLIRPSAVTHSVNQSQRLVELDFTYAGGKRLDVEIPKNENAAPPGYYMLFLVNNKGVPSKARMVPVGTELEPVGLASG